MENSCKKAKITDQTKAGKGTGPKGSTGAANSRTPATTAVGAGAGAGAGKKAKVKHYKWFLTFVCCRLLLCKSRANSV